MCVCIDSKRIFFLSVPNVTAYFSDINTACRRCRSDRYSLHSHGNANGVPHWEIRTLQRRLKQTDLFSGEQRQNNLLIDEENARS